MHTKSWYKKFCGSVKRRYTHCLKFFVVSLALVITPFAITPYAHADSTTISVDLAGANTPKYEIAVLQVLSEICPPLLDQNLRSGFFKTYNQELKKQLPTIDNPRAAIQYLSTQQDYKSILISMRSWTMGFPHEDNEALCTDLAKASY